MTIGVVKPAWRIASTPSTPEAPGMFTSMTIRSGWSAADLVQGVPAVLALAHDRHVELGADQGRERPPEQRLVIDQQDPELGRMVFHAVSSASRRTTIARPLIRRSMHVECPTDLLDPLAHGGEAEPAFEGAGDGRGVEARAVILDLERRAPGPAVDADGDAVGARMLARVGQRLLDDAQQLDLAPRRQRPARVALAGQRGGDAGLATVLAQVLAQ